VTIQVAEWCIPSVGKNMHACQSIRTQYSADELKLKVLENNELSRL